MLPYSCNPHSVFAVPDHLPERKSSAVNAGCVQGAHPMLGYPWSCSGL